MWWLHAGEDGWRLFHALMHCPVCLNVLCGLRDGCVNERTRRFHLCTVLCVCLIVLYRLRDGYVQERTNERFIELGRLPMSNREVGEWEDIFLCINNLSIKTFQQRFSPYTHTHSYTHTYTRTYPRTHSSKLEHTHTRAHPYSRITKRRRAERTEEKLNDAASV